MEVQGAASNKVFLLEICRGFMAVKNKLNRWYLGSGSLCQVYAEAGMIETI